MFDLTDTHVAGGIAILTAAITLLGLLVPGVRARWFGSFRGSP